MVWKKLVFTVEYYHPEMLIHLGADKMIAQMDI